MAGFFGGWIAGRHEAPLAFGVCAALAAGSFVLIWCTYREPKHTVVPNDNIRRAIRDLRTGNNLVVLAAVSAFLFLWNFNPLTTSVLQSYLTHDLSITEQDFGTMLSVQSLAGVLACIFYWFVCTRLPFSVLLHLSIASGIMASLASLWMKGPTSMFVAASVAGLVYQFGNLVTLDLCARASPSSSAGVMFAVLMSVCNGASTLAAYVGGSWFDSLGGHNAAFRDLAWIGAASTAACWFVVAPMMRVHAERSDSDRVLVPTVGDGQI
jgi:Na+/melibiose symporter-like transporter